ncbi:hypothetical protein ACFQZE_19010 [Paenibacillus sp. GCM10027627]|uniref:hypothetical protein n=1 Tax=unclassified Paenibacillus TaxID=185978 RepID=UPI0036435309
MLELEAEIYLKREDEGGMTKEGFSGMMTSFSVANDLVMCKVISSHNQDTIKRGQYHKVTIYLPYGEEYQDVISVGFCFTLNTGKRVIARGKVISFIEDYPC